jgi:hypothetical protein
VARVAAPALPFLKDGDPFLLTNKDVRGLITDSARLVVHQRSEQEESVWFRVETFLGDEMPHLDALASKKDVAGLTGYSVRPVCAVETYVNLNLVSAVDLIRRLADDIGRFRGVTG